MTRWLESQSMPSVGPPCGEHFAADGADYFCSLTEGHTGPHRGRRVSAVSGDEDVPDSED